MYTRYKGTRFVMKHCLFTILMLVNTANFADSHQIDIQLTSDFYVINNVYFSDITELKNMVDAGDLVYLRIDYNIGVDIVVQLMGEIRKIGVTKMNLSTYDELEMTKRR